MLLALDIYQALLAQSGGRNDGRGGISKYLFQAGYHQNDGRINALYNHKAHKHQDMGVLPILEDFCHSNGVNAYILSSRLDVPSGISAVRPYADDSKLIWQPCFSPYLFLFEHMPSCEQYILPDVGNSELNFEPCAFRDFSNNHLFVAYLNCNIWEMKCQGIFVRNVNLSL